MIAPSPDTLSDPAIAFVFGVVFLALALNAAASLTLCAAGSAWAGGRDNEPRVVLIAHTLLFGGLGGVVLSIPLALLL